MKTVQFYFDYLSPYAYLAWKRLKNLQDQEKIQIEPKPILFGALLNHWGQLGPAEIPPKKEHVFKQCTRFASLNHIPFMAPPSHPFNPLPALRVSLREVTGKDQVSLIDSLWDLAWGKGRRIDDFEILETHLNDLGYPGKSWMEQTTSPKIKDQLKIETQKAIEKRVFGIPTMIVDEELFWGNDDLSYLELYLEGKDPLTIEGTFQMPKIAPSIERKRPPL